MQETLLETDCKSHLYDLAMDKKPGKTRPYKAQGEIFLAKRQQMRLKLREVMDLLGLPSIGRYQNWENGFNRPGLGFHKVIKEKMGIDCQALYSEDAPPEPADKQKAIRAIIESIQNDLNNLRRLCATPERRSGAVIPKTEKEKS